MNLSHILASFHAAALDVLIAHARLADEALAEYKYSPNQPRVPAGSPEGGQWTDGGGGVHPDPGIAEPVYPIESALAVL